MNANEKTNVTLAAPLVKGPILIEKEEEEKTERRRKSVYVCVCAGACVRACEQKHLIFMVQLIGRSARRSDLTKSPVRYTPRKELAASPSQCPWTTICRVQ